MTPLRYAVLHHTGVPVPHFDFLFEAEPDGLLTTFRCARWPLDVGDRIEEIGEHRRLYLDYEGPVSDDRGHVSRVESGHIEQEPIAVDPPTLALRLSSGSNVTELTLVHAFTTGWTVSTLVRSDHESDGRDGEE